MLNAASWIEAAEGHGERLKEPNCVVAALYVTVGNRLERTPMALVMAQVLVDWDGHPIRSRTGNSALQLVRPVRGSSHRVMRMSCPVPGRPRLPVMRAICCETARRFAPGRPRRGSACRVRRPAAASADR